MGVWINAILKKLERGKNLPKDEENCEQIEIEIETSVVTIAVDLMNQDIHNKRD